MTRIAEILTRVRDSLADPNKERWTDARLVRLIDEAQKVISRRFELFRGETLVGLTVDDPTYKLPSDVWRITRASFDQRLVPMMTYDEMDKRDSAWMTRTGAKLEAIIFNNRSMNEIRVYPLPDEDFLSVEYEFETDFGSVDKPELSEGEEFGVVSDIDSDFEANFFNFYKIFGVTDQFEGKTGRLFGLISDITDYPGREVTFTSPFGVLGDAYYFRELRLQYVRDPKTVVTDQDELELSTTFDTVIKHYVIGMAFLDDLDSQNQERGQRALALYERDVELLGNKTGPTNATRAPNVRSTYRSFV
ncbi:structural protein [Vibrio phage VPMS1]|uniref:structural protein n=1 Tax=Vibrio phage VPMS1 TaxID=1233488 RepID=UPI0003584158|nr:structural protein [Vibrio phage VPMS1]AFV51091.1 hypothetical protein MS_012 [Vibrio phage VPMS1]